MDFCRAQRTVNVRNYHEFGKSVNPKIDQRENAIILYNWRKRCSLWQMEMLEKRQEEELKLIKEQAKASKEALEKQMQLMKEADMKAQGQLKKQLDFAVEKEKQAYKALQDMKQLFEKSKNDAQADREAANLTFEQMKEDSIRAQTELQSQLSAIALRETQTNERLNDMMRIWEEDRMEATAMREDIRSLTEQLVKANEPGFIRRIWRKIF